MPASSSLLSRDLRDQTTRSPHCPNDISREDEATRLLAAASGAGKCGGCAWGFFSYGAEGHQDGEMLHGLTLTRLSTPTGELAGYRSQCGAVNLYEDQNGRIGALRRIGGEDRFFPGQRDNWAFERFIRSTPLVRLPNETVVA